MIKYLPKINSNFLVQGSQLPGKWTDMDRLDIDLRPKLPPRNCPDENLTDEEDIFKRSALKRLV